MSDPRSYIIGITAFFLALMPAVSFGQTDRLSDQSTIQAKEEVTIEEIDTALGQLEASTDLDDPTKVRLQEYYTQAKSELESEATQQNSAARFNVTLASFLTGEQVSGREVVHPLRPFDPRCGFSQRGAIEPFVRYSYLNLGDEIFDRDLADPADWTNEVSLRSYQRSQNSTFRRVP